MTIGIGADLSIDKREAEIYTSSLRKCKRVIVRDQDTKKLLNMCDIRCEITPDIAFLYSELFPDIPKSDIVENRLLIDVFSEIQGQDKIQYYERILKENREYSDIRIAYTTFSDYLAGKDFIEYCKKEYPNRLVDMAQIDDVNDLVREITAAEKISSGRMHLLILALAYRRMIDVQEVSDKLKSFKKEYVLKPFCLEEVQSQIRECLTSLC